MCSSSRFHVLSSAVCDQMYTCLSSEQLAIRLTGSPVLGAHATSRTQSLCAGVELSSCFFHSVSPSVRLQILTVLSHDAVTTRRIGPAGLCEPTELNGAQLTALQPSALSLKWLTLQPSGE